MSDVSDISVCDIQMVSSAMNQSLTCPVMKVVGSGLVYGNQKAARGELTAYLNALMAAEKYGPDTAVSIVTDTSYVCFVDLAFRTAIPNFPNHKAKNFDLLVQIRDRWDPRVRVLKTKSHRHPEDAHMIGKIFGPCMVIMLRLWQQLRPFIMFQPANLSIS